MWFHLYSSSNIMELIAFAFYMFKGQSYLSGGLKSSNMLPLPDSSCYNKMAWHLTYHLDSCTVWVLQLRILAKIEERNVYPSYNGDSETFNSISYADCAGIEIPKVRRKTIALVITNCHHPECNKNEANCRTIQARSFTTLTTTPSSTPLRQLASQTRGQRQNCELFPWLGSLEVFNLWALRA